MIIFLYIAIFTFFLSVYMFIPFFALYVKELGGSYVEFALVLSVTGFIISIIQSYVGYLSDKFGSRSLVIGGGIISIIGFLFMGITYSKILIVPFYLIMNIGMGIFIPSLFTLISYTKTSEGNSFIPIYRSIQGAGVIIGPILGGFLIQYAYRFNIIMGSFLMLLSIVVFSLFFMSQNNESIMHKECKKTSINYKEALKEIVHNKSFIIIMLLFVFIEFSYDLISMSLPIVGLELGISTNITGMAFSVYFIMFTLFQIPINNALKKLSRRTALMLMGSFALVPCGLLLLNLPSYSILLIMGGIGLTIGSLYTFCSVLATEESPEDKKGTFMGVFNTIVPFTDVVSPIAVAFFIGINVRFPYLIATILVFLFVILSAFFYANKKEFNNVTDSHNYIERVM